MIRKATHDDAEIIVAMAGRFYETTCYAGWCPFGAETVETLVETLTNDHVMLVAEHDGEVVGMAGLFVSPFLFNAEKTGAYEVVWWVNPEAQGIGIGLELLQAIEPACREKGADIIQMVCMANSPPVAAKTYERNGYRHSETSFTRELN